MTPDQLSTLAAVAGLLKSIGTWPVLSIVSALVVVPWIILVWLSIIQHQRIEAVTRSHEVRFESVVKMYENNVLMVDEIKGLAEGYRDQLIWSTQVATEAKDIAKNNLHCPMVRKTTRPRDLQS
ncbi:MAG: hypothetical protein C4563_06500 [Desulfobulbus sp.]|jgi:hypothetical protein|nr:MAG: hypothetical protein C4563_06500 [Desulfobulbus sp.]